MIHTMLMKLGALTGCHQMPERSFFIKGYQFPLCARCTGILFGELLALPLWMVYHPSMFMTLFLIVPMAYDGIFQYQFGMMSNNRRRLATGLLAGYGLMSFYMGAFMAIIRWLLPNKPTGPRREDGPSSGVLCCHCPVLVITIKIKPFSAYHSRRFLRDRKHNRLEGISFGAAIFIGAKFPLAYDGGSVV